MMRSDSHRRHHDISNHKQCHLASLVLLEEKLQPDGYGKENGMDKSPSPPAKPSPWPLQDPMLHIFCGDDDGFPGRLPQRHGLLTTDGPDSEDQPASRGSVHAEEPRSVVAFSRCPMRSAKVAAEKASSSYLGDHMAPGCKTAPGQANDRWLSNGDRLWRNQPPADRRSLP